MSSSHHMRLFGLLAALLSVGHVRPQQPFDLDTTFRMAVDQVYVSSILPLPDGGAVASGLMRFQGELTDYTLTRLLSDGSRDPDFYTSGLGGGRLTPWQDRFYVGRTLGVRRILSNGQNDPSFAMSAGVPMFSPLQGGDYHVYPDGRVLMSGVHILSDSIRGFEGLYCLIWFSNTGYLDTTKTHRTCAGSLHFFRELPNGQFIGSLGNPPNTASWEGQSTGSNVIRFNADGEWDPGFQANVWWGTAFGFLPVEDGRIYAGGHFRIAGDPDTLQLVRFLSDGSLDPSFNNNLHFGAGDLDGSSPGPTCIHPLNDGRLIVTGGFQWVDGQQRGGICVVDTNGNLLNDYFTGAGGGSYIYQGVSTGTVRGITPAAVGADWYIWGSYHGYDDGTTNDTLQRMVSRLHGLNVGVQELTAEDSRQLAVWPNPAQDVLHVELPEAARQAIVMVRDALGRQVAQHAVRSPSSPLALDIRALPPGLYTVEVLDGTAGRWLAKWIME